MRILRVSEYIREKGLTMEQGRQLRRLIREGFITVARIGGVVCLDTAEADAALREYEPGRRYPGGLLTREGLTATLGLSRRQIDNGILEGWIIPQERNGRALYEQAAIEKEIRRRMGRRSRRG